MKTASQFEIKIERGEVGEGLPQKIIGMIEAEDESHEISTEWEAFFDANIPEAMARTVRYGLFIKWDYVTLQADLNDDLEHDGYIAIFCSRTNAENDVVEFDLKVPAS